MGLANNVGIDKFMGSDQWLANFKKRHGMVFRRNHGEAADIDFDALDLWRREVLSISLARFSPENVFNLDETGLFWKILPEQTLSFKGIFHVGSWITNLHLLVPCIFRGKMYFWQTFEGTRDRSSRLEHGRYQEIAASRYWPCDEPSLLQASKTASSLCCKSDRLDDM